MFTEYSDPTRTKRNTSIHYPVKVMNTESSDPTRTTRNISVHYPVIVLFTEYLDPTRTMRNTSEYTIRSELCMLNLFPSFKLNRHFV